MANFVLESKLYLSESQSNHLDRLFYGANKLYNNLVTYANKLLNKVMNDPDYQHYLKLYKDEKDEKLKKKIGKELTEIRKKYSLTEYDLQAYCKVQRSQSLHKFVGSAITQKMATRVWNAASSCLFGKGKKIHYKKINYLHSIEEKSNKSGIRFNKEHNTVIIGEEEIPIKIRKTDYYKQEALLNEIAYCRIIRNPHKTKMKYYVQIVFKGIPPKKENFKLGSGRIGIDIGPSAIAIVTNESVLLEPLAPQKISQINKKISDIQRKMEKSKQNTNPQNYNNDGTTKKGCKWNFSNNYKKLRQELRNLYRLKTCYTTEYQNKLCKTILSQGNEVATEDIDFISWAKKAKKSSSDDNKTDQNNKTSNQFKNKTIKLPNGKTKVIQVRKRRKRFGKSINNNRPASVIRRIEQILSYYEKEIVFLDTKTVKLSQYNHDTNTYIKMSLSERHKTIDNKIVQRDCYSAFLAYNYKDFVTINRQKCFDTFETFIAHQETCINNLKLRGERYPTCMGIK